MSTIPDETAPRRRARRQPENITVDQDLVALLNARADDLEKQFGFRPTLSQTMRHLLHKAGAL